MVVPTREALCLLELLVEEPPHTMLLAQPSIKAFIRHLVRHRRSYVRPGLSVIHPVENANHDAGNDQHVHDEPPCVLLVEHARVASQSCPLVPQPLSESHNGD